MAEIPYENPSFLLAEVIGHSKKIHQEPSGNVHPCSQNQWIQLLPSWLIEDRRQATSGYERNTVPTPVFPYPLLGAPPIGSDVTARPVLTAAPLEKLGLPNPENKPPLLLDAMRNPL